MFNEFSDKNYMSTKGLEPATSCVRDQDTPNSLKSLNSMKGLLHLGKISNDTIICDFGKSKTVKRMRRMSRGSYRRNGR